MSFSQVSKISCYSKIEHFFCVCSLKHRSVEEYRILVAISCAFELFTCYQQVDIALGSPNVDNTILAAITGFSTAVTAILMLSLIFLSSKSVCLATSFICALIAILTSIQLIIRTTGHNTVEGNPGMLALLVVLCIAHTLPALISYRFWQTLMYNSDDNLSGSKNLSSRATFSELPDSINTLTSVSDMDAAITEALMGPNYFDDHRNSFSESYPRTGNSGSFQLPEITDITQASVDTSIHDYSFLLGSAGDSANGRNEGTSR